MLEVISLDRIEPSTPDLNRLSRGRATNTTLGLLIAAALLLVSIPAGWQTSDHLTSDNDFCNSCHLPDGAALHTQIRDDFDGLPAPNLSARHATLSLSDRPDSRELRCMDCHGGVGLVGRAKVKLLSVKDAMIYLAGRFEEPKEMTWPLSDADCRQCHSQFQEKSRGFDGEPFHDKPVHNSGLGVDCVECHSAHDTAVDPERWFLNIDHIRFRCGQCHIEYGEP